MTKEDIVKRIQEITVEFNELQGRLKQIQEQEKEVKETKPTK